MKLSFFQKRPLVFSTVLLSASGILSRILGFFYRIFLSHTIGAEGLGIYQLIFPVFMLGLAISSFGIQNAISKYTAGYEADGFPSSQSQKLLSSGIFLSLVLCGLFSVILWVFADPIASRIIGEPRCAALLKPLSLTIPFSALHSCLNGYFYGLKKAAVPAISQIIEQFFRVFGVYVMAKAAAYDGSSLTPVCAVIGMLIGEAAAVFFTLQAYGIKNLTLPSRLQLRTISTYSISLSLNKVLLTLFQSAEAFLLPSGLKAYGMSSSQAVSTLGIISGIALPVVTFPSVFTNSLSVILLPAISEAQTRQDSERIRSLLLKTIGFCSLLGILCSIAFSLCGNFIGTTLFANPLAGQYICTLGWLCPFLFLTITLTSVLNGLGKTTMTLFLNLSSSIIRLLAIILALPVYGVQSYLFALLGSYLYYCVVALLFTRKCQV